MLNNTLTILGMEAGIEIWCLRLTEAFLILIMILIMILRGLKQPRTPAGHIHA